MKNFATPVELATAVTRGWRTFRSRLQCAAADVQSRRQLASMDPSSDLATDGYLWGSCSSRMHALDSSNCGA